MITKEQVLENLEEVKKYIAEAETIKEEIELIHNYLKVEKKQEPAKESKTLLVKKK